jgi:glycine cleavage system protein P-like pyridoxal-binding family
MKSQHDFSAHHLRFASLLHPGRGVSVPCDANGEVDMNDLSERLRNAYLGARALVGREYAWPTVEVVQ